MNAPAPLGFFLAAGLLVISNLRGLLPILARVAGYISLALCLDRSAWLAWFIGSIYLSFRKRDQIVQLTTAVLVLAGCLYLLTTIDQTKDAMQSRLQSFENLADDDSYNDRQSAYQHTLQAVLSAPEGRGLGSMDVASARNDREMSLHDSGLLELAISLGWPGAAAYLAALGASLFFLLGKIAKNKFDLVGAAIVLGLLPGLLLGSVVIGPTGMILWTFIGVGIGSAGVHVKPVSKDQVTASP